MDHQNKGERNGDNRLLALLKSSLILTTLDQFTAYLYKLLKTGFFGYLFTSYKAGTMSRSGGRAEGKKASDHLEEFRYGICRRMESSIFVRCTSRFMESLLGYKLKIYGLFLATFGAYTAIATIMDGLIAGSAASLLENFNIYVALVLLFASIPMILSKRTLANGILASVIGRALLSITGYAAADLKSKEGNEGHSSVAFVLGILLGIATYVISPIYIILAAFALLWAYFVLIRPEIGVLTLFFAMPILPTMVLAGIVIYTTLCWAIKLFRGKRILRLEPVDVLALAFLATVFFGGVVSLSSASLKPALLMVCLGFGYLLTVQLMTERAWMTRCACAAVLSATLVSVYGIVLYYLDAGYSSEAWLDSEMFGTIAGRAVATLENPNMLGEYLILIIPIAVSMFLGRGEGLRPITALLSTGIMGVCLILTWSRGAWLGLIIAALVFLFMWHHRSVWLVFAGVAAIPVLPYVLPASIVQRFTSIGNITDTSTSYRVSIWRASANMIEDHLLTGIGIGEGAWDRVYPIYAFNGIEAAPHSHNLFMQIWLETGLFGILIFFVFLFLLIQSATTMFASLHSPYGLRYLIADKKSAGYTSREAENKRIRDLMRIAAAGPLCGIIGVLAQGMTDYAWYNYRLYLMFWLACGLASAFVRSGRSVIVQEENWEQDYTRCEMKVFLDKARDRAVSLPNKQTLKTEKLDGE